MTTTHILTPMPEDGYDERDPANSMRDVAKSDNYRPKGPTWLTFWSIMNLRQVPGSNRGARRWTPSHQLKAVVEAQMDGIAGAYGMDEDD